MLTSDAYRSVCCALSLKMEMQKTLFAFHKVLLLFVLDDVRRYCVHSIDDLSQCLATSLCSVCISEMTPVITVSASGSTVVLAKPSVLSPLNLSVCLVTISVRS